MRDKLMVVTDGIEPSPFFLMREAHRPSMLCYHEFWLREGGIEPPGSKTSAYETDELPLLTTPQHLIVLSCYGYGSTHIVGL